MEQLCIKNVCVFCGSSTGNRQLYTGAAKHLATVMSSRGMNLIYGGGSLGLMGIIAQTMIEKSGEKSVRGIIPRQFSNFEMAGYLLGNTTIVDTTFERKMMMLKESDAIMALPGGFGTLEELFEAFAWSNIDIPSKPIGLLNINGFYDKLLEFLDNVCVEGFISATSKDRIIVAETPEDLLDKLALYC